MARLAAVAEERAALGLAPEPPEGDSLAEQEEAATAAVLDALMAMADGYRLEGERAGRRAAARRAAGVVDPCAVCMCAVPGG